MRVIVFFDLPVETAAERKTYAKFHKFLVKAGFLMMQESVYSKICLNNSGAESVEKTVEKNRPKKGLVQMLTITERQYAQIKYIVGEKKSDVLDTDERLVEL